MKTDLSAVIVGKHVLADEFLRLKNVMLIRYVRRWGGHPLDNKWWEGSINGEVEDWNSPKQLIKQAESKGLAWVVIRHHKNGKVSCVQKSE